MAGRWSPLRERVAAGALSPLSPSQSGQYATGALPHVPDGSPEAAWRDRNATGAPVSSPLLGIAQQALEKQRAEQKEITESKPLLKVVKMQQQQIGQDRQHGDVLKELAADVKTIMGEVRKLATRVENIEKCGVPMGGRAGGMRTEADMYGGGGGILRTGGVKFAADVFAAGAKKKKAGFSEPSGEDEGDKKKAAAAKQAAAKAQAAAEAKVAAAKQQTAAKHAESDATFELTGAGTAAANGPYRQAGAQQRPLPPFSPLLPHGGASS